MSQISIDRLHATAKKHKKKVILTRPKTKRDDKKMIFIVGMPRSGTSLVEQILTSHSKAFGGGNSAQWVRQQANFYIISHSNLM